MKVIDTTIAEMIKKEVEIPTILNPIKKLTANKFVS